MRPTELLPAIAAALACLLGLAWVQNSLPYIEEGDSYFHLRAAEQLASHGTQREFRQTEFSTWKDRYSDKDLLFHVALIPFLGAFSLDELIEGGKAAATAFDALILALLVLALTRLRTRFAAFWILLLFASDPGFLRSLLSVRPHLLQFALLLAELLLLIERRWKSLGVVAALHVLAHSSFVLLPFCWLAHAIACRVNGERVAWKALATIVAGIVTASLLHPYFPNNLELAFDQIVRVARNSWGLGAEVPEAILGQELLAPSPWLFARSAPAWVPALVALFLVIQRWRKHEPSQLDTSRRVATSTIALIFAGHFALSVLSARFFASTLLLACVLAASAWTELAAGRSLSELLRSPRSRWTTVALVVALVVGTARSNFFALRGMMQTQTNDVAYYDAMRWLDQHANRDELVYHNTWMDFSGLYFFRPEGRYIDALDPVFAQQFDPRLFEQRVEAYEGKHPQIHRMLSQDFGARWIFVSMIPDNKAFAELAARSPKIKLRFRDANALIFEVER